MPSYVNPHPYDLHLAGPDGRKVHIRHGKKVILPQYFDRYVGRYLTKLEHGSHGGDIKDRLVLKREARARVTDTQKQSVLNSAKKRLRQTTREKVLAKKSTQKRVVGRHTSRGVDEKFRKILETLPYPISNKIGVGIMSYNRFASLRRLVQSITKHTDLNKTTVFISDDGSSDQSTLKYLTELSKSKKFVVLMNRERLGIAGNSNRLLRCLERFPHKLILNDDAEVLAKGWDTFYFDAMDKAGFHHFCHRQPGVYGAKQGDKVRKRGVGLTVVHDKPHGAIMALDALAFAKVGYFDECFGFYGMEHVDWSTRLAGAGIQDDGFFDVANSNKFFMVHADKSAVPDRTAHFRDAKAKYEKMESRPTFVEATKKTEVPSISCIIPFVDTGRHDAILTVVENVRAQKFPVIDIILAEQDHKSRFNKAEIGVLRHVLVTAAKDRPFNKSMAFNKGVSLAKHKKLVLHDADTMAPAHYFKTVSDSLERNESCHFGDLVFYADKPSSDSVIRLGSVGDNAHCNRVVTYFEGGSIACLVHAYWKIGGFVEDFWGYGCEDCDFYARLSQASKWDERRNLAFLHLYHGRTEGWEAYHSINKDLQRRLNSLPIKEQIKRQVDIMRKLYPQFYR